MATPVKLTLRASEARGEGMEAGERRFKPGSGGAKRALET